MIAEKCSRDPVGLLRGGPCLLLHLYCKKLLCYILLQGKDRHDVNKYVVFRDKFDNTKGLILHIFLRL